MGEFKEEPKQGPPAYMVSFGDMMTLILTFFILLVSMSQEQQVGLVAKGVGSFMMVLQTHGLNGILSESEQAASFQEARVRFNLPPEEDEERREDFDNAATLELVRAADLEEMPSIQELAQPAIATFEPHSYTLSEASKNYIDRLASTLEPRGAQFLVLEGHAGADETGGRMLALERARSVRDYMIEELGFPAAQVQARAFLHEPVGASQNCVDVRLVSPEERAQ